MAALLAPGQFKSLNDASTTVTASLGGQTAQTDLRVFTPGTPGGGGPAPTPTPASGRLYVANFNAGTVLGYAGASTLNGTLPAVPTTTLTGFSNPEGVALDGGRDRMYVACNSDGTLRIVNNASTANGTAAGFINATITGFNIATTPCYDPANDRLYVGDQGNLYIFRNASTLGSGTAAALANTTITGFGSQVSGIAVDAQNNRLFLVSVGNESIDVIDSLLPPSGTRAAVVNRTVRGSLTGMGTPWGCALDVGRQILYVSNGGSQTVTIYENVGSPAFAGNVTPGRTLLGYPTSVFTSIFVDAVRNELYVGGGLFATDLRVYGSASTVNGTVAATRTLTSVTGVIGFTIDTTRN